MNINDTLIAIKKLDKIVIQSDNTTQNSDHSTVLSLNAEMMSLGFIMSESLFAQLLTLKQEQLAPLYHKLIPTLRYLKGADGQYQPMYPNFPRQLIQADSAELYFNAIIHYWSCGQWLPDYQMLPREIAFEAVKYHKIGLAKKADFLAIFPLLLQANDALSEQDIEIVLWFITNYKADDLCFPETIPFNENKSVLASVFLTQGKDIAPLVKTATDILRIATYLSDGDISLATNSKFKSLPRSVRKILVLELEKVINEEDIGRHRNKWIKLFHNLHVGDFSNKVYLIAAKARNNGKLESFNGQIEYYLSHKTIDKACKLLINRPGEYSRRLDQLLRLCKDMTETQQVIKHFFTIIDKIPSRNLLQLQGHLLTRDKDSEQLIVFPKGQVQSAVMLERKIKALPQGVPALLLTNIEESLKKRFSDMPPLGKVWLDPELMDCPIPAQQRSASSGLFTVARGTRLPLGNKNTLRFFIYWVGRDIDLSATLHNEDFTILEHVSYTNLRSETFQTYHSGDITSAPHGACEFIDITIDKAIAYGARYLTMNVLVYDGPVFAEHEVCYAGWMTRDKVNSNEIFDARTVEQKIDIRSQSKNVIPVVFDLLQRKLIWVDIKNTSYTQDGGNNIESNRASIEEKLAAIVMSSNKISLYQLFELHGIARGEIVDHKEQADTLFSLTEGVTPYHINKINADFIV